MTLQDLQTLYENSLDLTSGELPRLAMDLSGVDTVRPVIELYLPNNTLRISNPELTIDTNTDTAIISGIGVDSPYTDLAIVVDFTFEGPDNDEMYFTITGTTSTFNNAEWTLDYGFPAFIGTIFEAVPFSVSNCYLYTQEMPFEENESLQPGMYINGTVDLERMSGGFLGLLGNDPQTVQGYVDMNSNGSVIEDLYLDGTRHININIGLAILDTVEVTLSYDTVRDPTDSQAYALPYFQITGQFIFTSEGVDYHIPMYMRAFNTDSLRFESDITGVIQAGAAALTSLAKNLDIRNYLPTDFSLDTLVQITSIYAIFDTTQNTITNVGIEIQNRTPLVLADIGLSHKTLTLDNISLNLMISSLLSNPPQGTLAASGNISLEDIGTLSISAVLPDLSFIISISDNMDDDIDDDIDDDTGGNTADDTDDSTWGEADDGRGVKVTDFINLLLGSDCGLPDLTINDFSLSVTKQLQANVWDYDLRFNVLGPWWIGPSLLSVENFGLTLTSNPSYFHLTGYMYVTNIRLALEAEYTGRNGEWIFTGGTVDDSPAIPAGDLIEQLGYYFSTDKSLPAFLTEMTVTNIGTTFNTLTHDFTFHLAIHDVLVEGGPTVDLMVDIDIHKQNDGSYRKTFTGQLFLNTGIQQDGQEVRLAFDLVFSTDSSEYLLLATYNNLNGSPIYVKSLVSSLLGAGHWLTQDIPDSLTFTLKDALFAWYGPDKTFANSKLLFVLDMEDGINLSSLPLVGAQFPTNQTAKLAYKVMAASSNFSVDELSFFNTLLPFSSAKFPPSDTGVVNGMSLATTFQLGPVQQTLNLPIALNTDPTIPNLLVPSNSNAQPPVQPLWFNVQKTFGPVYFGRIGMLYDHSRITFYLDASLNAGGLSLTVDGLSVSTPLTEISPSFDIKGIAVAFSEGGLEIEGALLHQLVNGNDVYNGTATIKFESFGLAVLGSYSYYDGHPSMFIYGVLSAPMGGIPAFFVTGLSAGFGYNRDLVLPSLPQLGQFPLVSEAMGTSRSAATLDAEMTQLSRYIPPSIGEYWAAAGVKFTTYKVLDSFALVSVGFGNHLSLNLMGMSTAVAPPLATGNAVLAEIQMALLASIDPSSGFIGFSADLTSNSFVLSRDARLTGGFAFYAWYSGEHAMDFALSVGGYNNKFHRPAHYPIVPRVGLNWQLSSRLSLKGQLYFALTPSMMMAGGSLDMTWKDGSVSVWFSANVDFIIGWKPFTYSASSHIQVGASYKGHFGHVYSLSASANLDVWGPDFSGKAKIDLSVISVTVEFGASKKQSAKPITWTDFKKSFIPDNVLTFNVNKGLIAKASDGAFIVDQCGLEIEIDSIVPIKKVIGAELQTFSNIFGIAPMGIKHGDLSSTLNLTITDSNSLFDIVPVYKNVPTALWGENVTPSLTSDALVPQLVCGFIIKPKSVARPDATALIPASELSYALDVASGAVAWETGWDIQMVDSSRETLNTQIVNPNIAASRQRLMIAMNSQAPINLSGKWADMFIDLPKTIR